MPRLGEHVIQKRICPDGKGVDPLEQRIASPLLEPLHSLHALGRQVSVMMITSLLPRVFALLWGFWESSPW